MILLWLWILLIWTGTVIVTYPLLYWDVKRCKDSDLHGMNKKLLASIVACVPVYNIIATVGVIKDWLRLKALVNSLKKQLKYTSNQAIITVIRESLEFFEKELKL